MNAAILGIAALVGLIQALVINNALSIGPEVMMALRWVALGGLCYFAYQKKSLTAWILIATLLGAEVGFDFKEIGKELGVLSKIFMKLIKCVIAPLLFGTLIVGIAGHSDMKQVGRMGWKSLLYFEVVTTIALMIGLVAVNISQPGVGITQVDGNIDEIKTKAKTWQEIVLHTFPENIGKSVAENEVLQIVVFCILFAIGLLMVDKEHRRPILTFASSLSEVMFKFTKVIMYFAPFGVFGAMAATTAKMGPDVFYNLLKLIATLYVSLVAFILLVLVPIALYIKLPIRKFIKAVSEPVSIVFATASSEAGLPSALANMEKFGVPEKVVGFVLPTGYTFNLDGTTLYLSLAAVFVAQAAGMHLSMGEQVIMGLTLMLTSKGVAGVARASLVILAGTAASFNLPEWPIAAIMGVDALMDMARSSVNILGNCLATVVIAKWEGEWEPEKVPADFD